MIGEIAASACNQQWSEEHSQQWFIVDMVQLQQAVDKQWTEKLKSFLENKDSWQTSGHLV